VPHEWLPSWDDRALEMGAVCVRTFAWWWVKSGGKYPCADIDDTAASQVYTDGRVAKADGAVDRTRGVVIVRNGSLVLAEYSAENGDPTAFGVDEPYCAGQTVNGHGRGACQWGTQRWATHEGKDYQWMTAHYYPGAETVATEAPPAPTWLASVTAVPGPLTLVAGDEGTATVEIGNDGTAAWDTDVRLTTTAPAGRASPFYAPGTWLAPSEPVAVVAAPGGRVRVTFPLAAPAVTAPKTFTESFALRHGDQAFGADPLVTFTIAVTPRAGGGSPPGTGAASGDAVGGCHMAPDNASPWALAWLLGLLAVVRAVRSGRARRPAEPRRSARARRA
jgi:hypothetical protein